MGTVGNQEPNRRQEGTAGLEEEGGYVGSAWITAAVRGTQERGSGLKADCFGGLNSAKNLLPEAMRSGPPPTSVDRKNSGDWRRPLGGIADQRVPQSMKN